MYSNKAYIYIILAGGFRCCDYVSVTLGVQDLGQLITFMDICWVIRYTYYDRYQKDDVVSECH